MPEPIILRDAAVPTLLSVVRLGSTTLVEKHLLRSCEESYGRWGIRGFSVLEVPDGDYQLLARLRPIVASRGFLLEADGQELIAPASLRCRPSIVRTGPSCSRKGRANSSPACAHSSGARSRTQPGRAEQARYDDLRVRS